MMMSSCNQRQIIISFWITIYFLADSCYNYSTLKDADRKNTYVTPHHSDGLCDSSLPEGWYRFEGDAGTKMPTKPVDSNHCNTVNPGWLSGAQPTVADGEVSRKVCFTRHSVSCKYSNQIMMKNCGSYFIYKLVPPSTCSSRYCSTD